MLDGFLDMLPRAAARAVRHRRGALRLAVGARLPPGVRPARLVARALPRRAAHRAHRDRRRPDARGRARAAAPHRPRRSSPRASTVPTSATPSPTSAARRPSWPPSSRPGPSDSGIVYCLSRKRVEEVASKLRDRRREGRRLPRRASRGRAHPRPGRVPARRGPRRGRDGRLRHGHRQARRALRGALRHAQEHRGLLPGDRPLRPRRPARRGAVPLRPPRRRHRPLAHRERRQRRAGPRRAPQAPGDDRLRRGDHVPAPRPARLLRRAARRGLRQLRRLPRPAAALRRDRRRAEGAERRCTAPASASASATSSTCCAVTPPRRSSSGTTTSSASSASGEELSRDEWTSVIRQLIHHGYLRQDIAAYSALKLQPSARALLRGEIELRLAKPRAKPPKAEKRRKRSAALGSGVARRRRERHGAHHRRGPLRAPARAAPHDRRRAGRPGLRRVRRSLAHRHGRAQAVDAARSCSRVTASALPSSSATARRSSRRSRGSRAGVAEGPQSGTTQDTAPRRKGSRWMPPLVSSRSTHGSSTATSACSPASPTRPRSTRRSRAITSRPSSSPRPARGSPLTPLGSRTFERSSLLSASCTSSLSACSVDGADKELPVMLVADIDADELHPRPAHLPLDVAADRRAPGSQPAHAVHAHDPSARARRLLPRRACRGRCRCGRRRLRAGRHGPRAGRLRLRALG